ncbi:unnamed protein product [Toxocara canis]|uniref:Organic solute transporter alpha-like protein 3 n=1 Tax=Toxocara canis TaxID=6265 RepID=A0A183UBP1_TOXCA|nr:unnamed protein product [Toxocara canis]
MSLKYSCHLCNAIFFLDIESIYLVAIIVSSLVIAATAVLAVIHLYYIHMLVNNENVQCDLYYLALLFPIIGFCSLLAMFLPRSARLMYAVCSTYIMLSLLKVIALMRDIFGGRTVLACYLLNHQEIIRLNPAPCCCICLPKVCSSERNIRRLEWMVLQSPIIRILLEIINVIAFLEQVGIMVAIDIVETLSMLVATYGSHIMMELGKEKLNRYRFSIIFHIINITHIVFTMQKLILDFSGELGLFVDGALLRSSSKAMFWNDFALTLEMFALSVSATKMLNPRKTDLFKNAIDAKTNNGIRGRNSNRFEPTGSPL